MYERESPWYIAEVVIGPIIVVAAFFLLRQFVGTFMTGIAEEEVRGSIYLTLGISFALGLFIRRTKENKMGNRQYLPRRNAFVIRIIPLLLILAFTGCASIRLIADYDEQIDTAVTDFQRKIETFLTHLERNAGKDEAKYQNNTKFYDEAKVDLSAIRVRAAAIPKNDITLKLIDLLLENISNLENLHKLGISAEQVSPIRSAINTQCTAILKLEIAKKRGKS